MVLENSPEENLYFWVYLYINCQRRHSYEHTLDDGRTELWQWDTGRKIVVDDNSVSEVHYSKYSSTQAITRPVINGKAEIPNYLLQDTHAVTVYAYSGSIENGYTMAEKTFDVAKKPKPANYVETEEDKAILVKLKAEIGDLSELYTEAKDNLVSAINEAAASGMEIEMPFYEEDVGNVLTQVKSSGEYYKYAPKSIAGYGVKYIAEGYIGQNNEFICTTSSEEVIRRCSEIDDGCLCAIRIIDEDSYTIAIAEGGLCGDKGMIFSRVHTDYRGNLYTHWCSLNIESDTVSWSTYKCGNIITNNYYVEIDGIYPNYTLSSATPIQDIKTAYLNGKTLFCRCIREGYTAVLPLFVPGPINNLWIFSGSGGIYTGYANFPSQYFTIAVTSKGVMAANEIIATEEYVDNEIIATKEYVNNKIIATKEYVDNKKVVVKSSTAGSTKKFKITVDDAGTLSAVEVTT